MGEETRNPSEAGDRRSTRPYEYEDLLPFAQLLLRLLGIMFFVDGAGAIVGGTVHAVYLAKEYASEGLVYSFDAHSFAWVAGGIPVGLIGLYLAADGKWVLRNVLRFQSLNNKGETKNAEVSAT